MVSSLKKPGSRSEVLLPVPEASLPGGEVGSLLPAAQESLHTPIRDWPSVRRLRPGTPTPPHTLSLHSLCNFKLLKPLIETALNMEPINSVNTTKTTVKVSTGEHSFLFIKSLLPSAFMTRDMRPIRAMNVAFSLTMNDIVETSDSGTRDGSSCPCQDGHHH